MVLGRKTIQFIYRRCKSSTEWLFILRHD